ncbi:MAG: hypothetical protein OEY89_04330 [Gammaproteobacteria bacterium]|nr:hypothetical protein [Gammaproteobacteria bacterium]
MHRYVSYILLFLVFDAMAIEACIILPADPLDYLISTDGETIIFINQKRSCLKVIKGQIEKSILFKDIDRIEDINPNMSVSLSYDSRYIVVGFNASESVHVIKVLALKDMSVVLEENATTATWMKESNRLIIVPNYGIDEYQDKPGLMIYSPELKEKKYVANSYLFTGKIITGGNILIANTIETTNDEPVFRSIIFDVSKNEEIEVKLVSE